MSRRADRTWKNLLRTIVWHVLDDTTDTGQVVVWVTARPGWVSAALNSVLRELRVPFGRVPAALASHGTEPGDLLIEGTQVWQVRPRERMAWATGRTLCRPAPLVMFDLDMQMYQTILKAQRMRPQVGRLCGLA